MESMVFFFNSLQKVKHLHPTSRSLLCPLDLRFCRFFFFRWRIRKGLGWVSMDFFFSQEWPECLDTTDSVSISSPEFTGRDVKFCRFVPYDIFRNKQPQMVPEDLNWFPGFGFDSGPNLQPWMWEYQQSLRSRNLSIEFEGRSWSCAVPTDIETHEHHVLHLVNTIQPYDLYSLCIYLYTNLDFFSTNKKLSCLLM